MNEIPDYLAQWIVGQRWYAGKGRTPRFELIGGFTLACEGAIARVHLVLDHAEHPVLYQIPVTERTAPLDGVERALIATVHDDATRYYYDGPHDPAFASALLRLILDESQSEPESPANGRARSVARGHRDQATGGTIIRSSRVLGGEQSNTSIVFQTSDTDGRVSSPVICKLFRALHDGDNPDVILTEVLGLAGSAVAPRAVGNVTGEWPDTGTPSGLAVGHLAFAQEFLPDVHDAWRVAIQAAEVDEDFSERARALGETTAEMHATLAAALPSRATTPADIATVITSMRQRFELAAAQIPRLSDYRRSLEDVYRRATESPWPALQRIHGDFHLGQVLSVPDRGWVVLDFEGEPMRPMSERSLPDIPLRDVAGMLRSFDYVAGSLNLTHPGHSASAWASTCRHAFLDGYIQRSGRDLRQHRAVLDAFEIDKALYEAVYEARNRPAWLSIPTDAITRLVERADLS